MKIIDGNKIAKRIREEIKDVIMKTKERKPGLGFILVGNNPLSLNYVKMKKKDCEQVGIISSVRHLPEKLSAEKLTAEIEKLNEDNNIDGIIIQQPLPSHLNLNEITLAIDVTKDIDGFHPLNVGKMFLGYSDGFIPCTPLGIKYLLDAYKIAVEGKHVVIVGRSNIVGKPLGALLVQKREGCNATVTIAHKRTEKLSEITKMADILVVAIGKPKFIKEDMVKEGATVIDVGITKVDDKLVGDVDFEKVSKKVSFISPVPGGVGPMTRAFLLKNTLDSWKKKLKL